MGAPHDDGFLVRFEDGPMAARSANGIIPKEVFGWPLPDRLAILTHPEAEKVAFWDADDPDAADLPSVLLDSPSAVVYAKVSESQLPEDVPGVVRGAQYRLETP